MQITFADVGEYAVLRVDGALTLTSSSDLRDAMFKAIAEQPRGLICDMRTAQAVQVGLAVFHVVADQLAAWPGCALALVTADPRLRRQLDVLGLSRRVRVVADLEAALNHAPATGSVTARRLLPGSLGSVQLGRDFIGETLSDWGMTTMIDPARLVATELLTNAVCHTTGPIGLRLSSDPLGVVVAVSDRGGLGTVSSAGVVGLGLAVVETVSLRWGILARRGGGHLVWARLGKAADGRGPLPGQAD